ncbi:hypothetical protein DICPUDRAFT_37919 [Dictyostelium purpureum]|uniref:Sec1-like family protein n=1 Tax=Dictyostelium purpureum TaxID=5786 RepID=F0ZTL7_DICPU|nr:uncharacterized protein DICPUDRAFT_37919 [Dictyostelium purpureum]EGC32721.1 hypothetical protein DICPUDRAFT_37919 [Dictyostelium purpureum]|eukprot:XP_003290754.1 hypothetical protein DICPUDRAFT_37919 [Dictyostelium purpureum]
MGGSTVFDNSTSLVIDPTIIGLMNLFIDGQFLKQNGIDRIYELKPGKLDTENKNIIYLLRPRVKYMNFISDHIRSHLYEFMKKNYSIIYLPKVDPICNSILEEQGVYGNFSTITSMQLDLIPFDSDVLSMELSNSYRDYLLGNDKSICYEIAKSINKLQSLFGIIPLLKGKGKASKSIVEILHHQESNSPQFRLEVSKEIESILFIDREIDYVTTLCTPLTYEGLIDEYFSINNNTLMVDTQLLVDSMNYATPKGQPNQMNQGSQTYSKRSQYPLHSGDKIFKEVRDLNFSSLMGAGGVLNKKAKQQFDDKKQLTGNESITAIRDLMKRVNASKQEEFCLQVHVGIAEKIHEITSSTYFQNRLDCEQKLLLGSDVFLAEKYIQDCINIKDPILKILRLLALYSITNNGLPLNDYETIKSKIVTNYGMDILFPLNQLEKIGLIQIRKQQDSKPLLNFESLKEELNLIVDDIDETNPSDFSYVYSGYAPILIRIIQYSLNSSRIGWKSIENSLKLLPGPNFEESQVYLINNNTNNNNSNNHINNNNNNINSNNNNNLNTSISLVFFVGGVTFSEISALRFLGKQTNRKFLILTTKLINGDSLIQSFLESP